MAGSIFRVWCAGRRGVRQPRIHPTQPSPPATPIAVYRMPTINLETASAPLRRQARAQWGCILNELSHPDQDSRACAPGDDTAGRRTAGSKSEACHPLTGRVARNPARHGWPYRARLISGHSGGWRGRSSSSVRKRWRRSCATRGCKRSVSRCETAKRPACSRTSVVFKQRVRKRDVARSISAATGSDRLWGVASAQVSGVRAFDAVCLGCSRSRTRGGQTRGGARRGRSRGPDILGEASR